MFFDSNMIDSLINDLYYEEETFRVPIKDEKYTSPSVFELV